MWPRPASSECWCGAPTETNVLAGWVDGTVIGFRLVDEEIWEAVLQVGVSDDGVPQYRTPISHDPDCKGP